MSMLAGQHAADRRQIRRRPPAKPIKVDAHAAHGCARRLAAQRQINRTDPYFGFSVPTSVPGIEPHLLYPFKTWQTNPSSTRLRARRVAMVQKSFVQFEEHGRTRTCATRNHSVRLAAE